MIPELKPCPFCGDDKIEVCTTDYNDGFVFAITCRTQDCHGAIWSLGYGLFASKEQAITAWNARAPHWQPIETAPKHIKVFAYCECGDYWTIKKTEDRCLIEGSLCEDGLSISCITHWMPLPEGPKE